MIVSNRLFFAPFTTIATAASIKPHVQTDAMHAPGDSHATEKLMSVLRKAAVKEMLPRSAMKGGISQTVADHHRDLFAEVLARAGDRKPIA